MALVIPHIRARRFIRKMRGGSRAQLLQADDGNYYVVKFNDNNPESVRILINESVSSFLLQKMGIHTPEIAWVEIDDGFLRANPEILLPAKAQGATAVTAGLHFGSQYPGNPAKSAVYDFLPDAMLHRIYNRSHFFGALVFDKWVSNADGRQAIFFPARLTAETGESSCWISQMIDNGHAFQARDWTFRDSPVQGLYLRPAMYGRHVSMLKFWPWIEIVTDFRRELFEEIFAALPVSWTANQQPALQRLLQRLYERRTLVPELVRESIERTQRTETTPYAEFDTLAAAAGGFPAAAGNPMKNYSPARSFQEKKPVLGALSG